MKTLFKIIILACGLMIWSEAFAGNENIEKAVRYYHKRDYKQAVRHLKEYVSQRPSPAAYYMLGYANYKLKKFDEANRYFSEAYLIDPEISPRVMRLLKKD